MEKKFAQGFCFKKIFIFFLIGCLFGTYYEEILHFVSYGNYSDRQGLIYGPFSPIYGLGVVVFVALLGKSNDKRSVLKTFILASFIGGFTEYMTSFIADKLFNVSFWDYTGYFLNINGRTTIPFMLVWGAGGTVVMKYIYPHVSKWIEKIPLKIGNIIYSIVFVFIILDMIITYAAFGRAAMRDNGQKPMTFIGEFIDQHYDDEFMANKFPVMYQEK